MLTTYPRSLWACGLLLVTCSLLPSCGSGGNAPAPILARYVEGGNGIFVDADGREIMLRGINVNSLAEYWQYDPDVAPVFEFTEADMDRLASMGFNLVRLLVTWSYVEPSPGEYDEAYIARVGDVIDALHARGIFTLVDMHQDAWGPSLSAPPGTVCEGSSFPAPGWDGAPAWATIVDDATSRCAPTFGGVLVREFSPAVVEAWSNFMNDAEGPGGVGVQTRFHAMWEHLAARLGGRPGVMGYDVINEPNVFFGRSLEPLYTRAVEAIRAGEARAGVAPRIIVVEPSAGWAQVPSGWTVRAFTDDPQMAFGPHTYQDSITNIALDQSQIQRVRDEAAALGGWPVLVGEWGSGPEDAETEGSYIQRMLQYQDEEHWSTANWVYQSACGDPHAAYHVLGQGGVANGWGLNVIRCDIANVPMEPFDGLVNALSRPALHWAPGAIDSIRWVPGTRRFEAAGSDALAGAELRLYLPEQHADLQVALSGAADQQESAWHGGRLITARAVGGAWSLEVRP
ncbi:MAG: cellulase family glycosylhydrolase [Sandaracinaceae bacterium]|nr:cellulase family glycosylhydrolase [Sandaracinaceae bacterium]